MQWNYVDVERYRDAKEYIDTLFIPLIPFQLSADKDLEKLAFQSESLRIFLDQLEKELSGRTLLTPDYPYLLQTSKDDEVVRIGQWIEDVQQQPFEHIFFFTHDAKWKKYERELDGVLIWIPSTASGDIHSPDFVKLIRDQVAEMSELIRSYW